MITPSDISFHHLQPREQNLIEQIADWYATEWNIPAERTRQRLSQPYGEDVLFQLVLYREGKPVATGGLYHNVGITYDQPRFKQYGPWVALLYTDPAYRNQGLGRELLLEIEKEAHNRNWATVYLFTFSAESLYRRNGWSQLERVLYKGHDTVVMEKKLP